MIQTSSVIFAIGLDSASALPRTALCISNSAGSDILMIRSSCGSLNLMYRAPLIRMMSLKARGEPQSPQEYLGTTSRMELATREDQSETPNSHRPALQLKQLRSQRVGRLPSPSKLHARTRTGTTISLARPSVSHSSPCLLDGISSIRNDLDDRFWSALSENDEPRCNGDVGGGSVCHGPCQLCGQD